MNLRIVSFTCLLALVPAGAQQPKPHLYPSVGGFCPAGLHVQQGSGGGLVDVRQKLTEAQTTITVLPKFSGTRYHLTIEDKQVVSMQITAHGFGQGGRYRLLNDPSASDLSKALKVRFEVKEDGTPASDIALEHFGGVNRIDIDSVNYADGSSWHPAPGQRCTVEPDRFMLVSSR